MKTHLDVLVKPSKEMSDNDWALLDDILLYKRLARLARMGCTAALWQSDFGIEG